MEDKKTWRLAIRKLDYLRLEIETRQTALKEFEKQFEQRLADIDPEYSFHDEQDESNPSASNDVAIQKLDDIDSSTTKNDASEEASSKEVTQPQQEKLSPVFKKLWKEIASKTHPDATGNDEELIEVYKQASKSFENNDAAGLVEAAAQITLIPKKIEDEIVQTAQERVKELSSLLGKMERNSLWEWGNASKEVQDAFIDGVLKMRKERKK